MPVRRHKRQVDMGRAIDASTTAVSDAAATAFRQAWRNLRPRLEEAIAARGDPDNVFTWLDDDKLWDAVASRFYGRVSDAFEAAIERMTGINDSFYQSRGYDLTGDAQEILDQWLADSADDEHSILTVIDDLRVSIYDKVTDWNENPDISDDDLRAKIQAMFSEQAADGFSDTNVTDLNSSLETYYMDAAGVNEWVWDARGPAPCDFCLDQHGETFEEGDEEPPAHPHCHCKKRPVVPVYDDSSQDDEGDD